jgi:hypothetical protein
VLVLEPRGTFSTEWVGPHDQAGRQRGQVGLRLPPPTVERPAITERHAITTLAVKTAQTRQIAERAMPKPLPRGTLSGRTYPTYGAPTSKCVAGRSVI